MFLKEGGLLSIGMDGIIVHVALLYLLYGYFFFPRAKLMFTCSVSVDVIDVRVCVCG